MAQVASCPQCEQELLIPGGAEPDAWAKCPACQAFFPIQDAAAREIPAVEVVDAQSVAAEKHSAATVADLPSVATWTSGSQQDNEIETSVDEELLAEELEFESPVAETPEAAAQRIDQLFRSAKTLADIPPIETSSKEQSGEFIDEWATSPGMSATVDLTAQGAGDAGAGEDFELEPPADLPHDAATWDDSHHMDRLLAGIKDQPKDEFAPTGRRKKSDDAEQGPPSTSDWMPDEGSPSIMPRADKPRRKRSLVRTLLMTIFGGVVGLGAGYYALLWMQGPTIDFLEIAKYLPKSILPPSFSSQSRQLAAAPARPSVPPVASAEEAGDTAVRATDEPAEKQAAFNEPVAPVETNTATDDRYGTAATDAEAPVAEPAALDAPPATPLAEETKAAEPIHIAGTPTFTLDEFNAALEAAKQAQPNLVNGSLTDGKEVQQAKGAGYLALADLAQKVMFVDASQSPDDASKASQEAEELFRQTLVNPLTRGEVAQIVVKWIATSKRRHGGVFFAGSVTSQDSQGSVVEAVLDLGTGQSLTVLVPASLAQQLGGTSQPIGIVGWIVDNPAESVTGYTGSAPQAIFASKLIPLE